jgi:myo-inositol-1(or 4)-monophosphatase
MTDDHPDPDDRQSPGRHLDQVATHVASAAGAVAAGYFGRDPATTTKDNPTDYVTEADHAAQATAVALLADRFPDDALVAEEDGASSTLPGTGQAWVVDPIDGTNNFVRGIPLWASSVAGIVDGEPVAAATAMPAVGETVSAADGGTVLDGRPVATSDRASLDACTVAPTVWLGMDRREEYGGMVANLLARFGDVRRFGSAQVTLAAVATGGLEGAVTTVAAHPWDTVAGVHLVRRAGGTVTDLDGDPWRYDSTGLVASNGCESVHGALLESVSDWA